MPVTREELENLGSLITLKDSDRCLGSLFASKEHGTFDAEYGKVPVTETEAEQHNRALDGALVKGLEGCKVGQWGTFYHHGGRVQTFTGVVVDPAPVVHGKVITFVYKGNTFRGRLPEEAECFRFKRIT